MNVKKLNTTAKLPTRTNPTDAGLDLYCSDDVIEIMAHDTILISTGIAVEIPFSHVGMICDRSSMGKKGLKVMGGIIDCGYTGEIKVLLCNTGREHYVIKRGDKIAQLLVLPIAIPTLKEVETLDNTTRGDNGFGSSGV